MKLLFNVESKDNMSHTNTTSIKKTGHKLNAEFNLVSCINKRSERFPHNNG